MDIHSKCRIVIIIPVLDEAAVIEMTASRVRDVMQKTRFNWSILFVDDGSSDGTRSIIKQMSNCDSRVSGLVFSRNFGHQAAITAGIDFAICDAAIVMDGDLQDPPEIILAMIEKWVSGADVVTCVRQHRAGETFFKRFTASCFYFLCGLLNKSLASQNAGDFRLYGNRALHAIRSLREQHRYIRAMSAWIGLKHDHIFFDRASRAVGKSKYSLKMMISLAGTAIMSFTGGPSGLCFLLALFKVVSAVFIVLLGRLLDPGMFLTWTVLASILLVGGTLLTILGVLGAYLHCVYEEAKQRPLYLIESAVNFPLPSVIPSRVGILPQRTTFNNTSEAR